MQDRLARLVELVGAALLPLLLCVGAKGMTNSPGAPPFTVGLRILNPRVLDRSCYLSRGDKQKQQRMRGDLCPVEELSVRLACRVSFCLKGTKKPKGLLNRLYDDNSVALCVLLGLSLTNRKGEQLTSTIIKHTIEIAGAYDQPQRWDAFCRPRWPFRQLIGDTPNLAIAH